MALKKTSLTNKRVLLGITGSVAAYKAVDLIRRLKDAEASVTAVMTDASKRFITPLSVELASGTKVYEGLFDDPLAHIGLAVDADVMLVAPATANTIAKLANGLADDLLSACYLAFRGPVLIAPAMNERMYEHPATAANLEKLKGLGVIEIPPCDGLLACGIQGKGRMADVADIIEALRGAFYPKDLAGRRVVVTAGPTREFMDSVRFISNRSSGKMGYALARAAHRRGADVLLISGPTSITPPSSVQTRMVTSASEMHEAVLEAAKHADALIMAAAVADFTPKAHAEGKAAKGTIKDLELSPTPDILTEVCSMKKHPVTVGFAAEAGLGGLERAEEKYKRKGAQMVVYNDILEPGAGFDTDTNKVVIIDSEGRHDLPMMGKDEVADAVVDRMAPLLGKGKHK